MIWLEIPAFYVDAVVLDETPGATYFLVLNREPEPDEPGVGVERTVQFDVGTHAADSPVFTQVQVWVAIDGGAEVLALDLGNSPQPGYDGPESGTQSIDANTLRVRVDRTTPWPSLAEVTVRVRATSTLGQILQDSWTFTVEDRTAPVLESAKSRTHTIVRLTFDEPVVMDASAGGALNPANYTFERVTVPAVNVVPVAVTQVTTSSVDVLLDIEITGGATYRVTVANVEDLLGNVIGPPGDSLTFGGYVCPRPERRSFDLWRMVPQKSRDEDPGDLRKFLACLQEVTDLLLCLIDRWTDILDPDIAPEPFLDAMLQDLGNPFAFDLDEADKRRLIRVLLAAYRQKGTAIGIINLVRFFLGIEVTINTFLGDEGWDLGVDELGETTILGPGTSFALYSFEVLSPVELTQEQRDQIEDIANYMKPAHTHLIRIVEPVPPLVIDHLELGLSELGPEWILH